MMPDAIDYVILVTGGTRGIGLETCRLLAERGCIVLLGARDHLVGARIASDIACNSGNPNVSAIQLDVTDDPCIASAAAEINTRFGRLDGLVNNAGIRIEPYGYSPSKQPLELWRQTFETNLFGTISVTKAMLPLIRASRSGRIVNVSSLLASIGLHSDPSSYTHNDFFKSLPAYSASKSGLNTWTVHLAYELRQTGIKVNSAHPGYSRTAMNEGQGVMDARDGAATSVELVLMSDDGPTGGFFHNGERLPW